MRQQSSSLSDLEIKCPVCSAPAPADQSPRTHLAPHNGINYTLHNCPSCAIQFWSPLQADPTVYEDEGFEAYRDYHTGTRPFPRWAEPLFTKLPKTTGLTLDVGCGDGAVLARLSSLGFEAHGIDLDKKSIEIARTKYGLTNVQSRTLDEYVLDCKEHQRRFDLITFFEVLEHQDNPLSFLDQVSRIAKPDGWIAGSVPNRNRFLANLDRKLGTGDLPPHHFLWFSSAALKGLLERSGFRNVTVVGVGAISFSQLATKLSLVMRRVTDRSPKPVRVLLTPIAALLAQFAAAPVFLGLLVFPAHLFFRCQTTKPE